MSVTLEEPKKEKEIIPLLLRMGEVAKLLSLSRQSIHNLIVSGDLKASRVNPARAEREHLRITRDSLLKFYQKRFGHSLIDALTHSYKS